MRIAHSVEWSGFQGGAERMAFDIAVGLRQRGHENVLLPERSEGPQRDDFIEAFDDSQSPDEIRSGTHLAPIDVVLVHRVASTRRLSELTAMYPVVSLIHDVSLTCPRTHRMFPLTGIACDRRAGLGCAPCVLLPGRDRNGRLGVLPVRENARLRSMVRALPASIVPSGYLKDVLVRHGWHPDRVHLVPPARVGLDPDYTLPRHLGRVLFVGALTRGKGVDLLLSALLRIEGWQRLEIVGAGPWAHALPRLVRMFGMEDRVIFRGRLSADAVSACYQSTDVVAFPSRAPESFGLVGLEAMAHGRPVVAFDLGGVREWLAGGRTGLAVDAGDVTAFGDALQSLLADPERAAAMGRSGRSRWQAKFGVSRFLDGIERVLMRVAGAGVEHTRGVA